MHETGVVTTTVSNRRASVSGDSARSDDWVMRMQRSLLSLKLLSVASPPNYLNERV